MSIYVYRLLEYPEGYSPHSHEPGWLELVLKAPDRKSAEKLIKKDYPPKKYKYRLLMIDNEYVGEDLPISRSLADRLASVC